jgi:hypothetical protein
MFEDFLDDFFKNKKSLADPVTCVDFKHFFSHNREIELKYSTPFGVGVEI